MRHLLIKSKKTGAPLLSVEENQSYRLPTGYTIGDVIIEVWQEKPTESAMAQPGQLCQTCGSLAMEQATCCSERAAGYSKKWVCGCGWVGYVK